MIADRDAVELVRRAILAHIQDLAEDLEYWTDQLDLMGTGSTLPNLAASAAASLEDPEPAAVSEG